MGNQIHTSSKKKSIHSGRRQSKINTFKFTKQNADHDHHFFTKHCQNNKNNDLTDIKSFDGKRKVFISLLGLFQTWQKCPSVTLYFAILILPLKNKWIYSNKCCEEFKDHIISQHTLFSDKKKVQSFVEMLQWKDKQGLVIWMLDYDYKINKNNKQILTNPFWYSNNTFIHPFWYYLSNKLSNLTNPMTGNKYNKLNLNIEWWMNNNYKIKYNTNKIAIVSEFYFLNMKFNTIKEILYQTHANTLYPIEYYSDELNNCLPEYQLSQLNDDEDDKYNNWYIASDYVQI